MRGARVVVVGDALLDRDLEGRVERLCPDAPVPVVDDPVERCRPGGAALAASLVAADGRQVTLVTALADDEGGLELARLLSAGGVDVVDVGLQGATPEKVRVRAEGRSLLRIDRGGRPGRVGPVGQAAVSAVRSGAAVLVSDYGRGLAADAALRAALTSLEPRAAVVWDPHPRGPEPPPGVRLATPNRVELAVFAPASPPGGSPSVALRAASGAVVAGGAGALAAQAGVAGRLRERWRARGVAVTLGSQGALLVEGDGPPLVLPAPVVSGGDPCGAGDRFSSAAAALLADGALPSEAVEGAVRVASAFVARGGAGALAFPAPSSVSLPERGRPAPAEEVVARARAANATVVAAGGCFDLLHAGHVGLLQSARALGDCLVVCLNSDASVRRLKGPDRPLVPESDRAAVLLGLGCVDAVAVFDEDTPEAVLARLRPDVFAKGADYSLASLPETELLASWGGQVVLLPYLEGRSTTSMLEEVARRVSS